MTQHSQILGRKTTDAWEWHQRLYQGRYTPNALRDIAHLLHAIWLATGEAEQQDDAGVHWWLINWLHANGCRLQPDAARGLLPQLRQAADRIQTMIKQAEEIAASAPPFP